MPTSYDSEKLFTIKVYSFLLNMEKFDRVSDIYILPMMAHSLRM